MNEDLTAPFRNLKETTLCPFARGAVLEYAANATATSDLNEAAKIVAQDLAVHMRIGRLQRLGGYVARLPSSGNTFEADVRDFAAFVNALGEHDASCREALSQDPTAVGWSLKIDGEPVFLNLFSAFYPQRHSKYISSPGSFWIFFQPEYVFEQHGINRDARETKINIRRCFAEAGMEYDATQIDRRRKAHCFVFPLRPEDGPIEWWTF